MIETNREMFLLIYLELISLTLHEISGDEKLLCGSCAIKSKGEANDKTTKCPKRKGSPTVGSELSSKKKKASEVKTKSVSIHADSDGSEAVEDGDQSDSIDESKEWSPTKETDILVELVFRRRNKG